MSTTDDLRAIRDSVVGGPAGGYDPVDYLADQMHRLIDVLIAGRETTNSQPGTSLADAGSTPAGVDVSDDAPSRGELVESPSPVTIYITFGVRYLHEVHPSGLPVHPGGWWEIRGLCYTHARAVAHALTQGKFSTDYLEEPERHLFPRGCLFRVEARTTEASG